MTVTLAGMFVVMVLGHVVVGLLNARTIDLYRSAIRDRDDTIATQRRTIDAQRRTIDAQRRTIAAHTRHQNARTNHRSLN